MATHDITAAKFEDRVAYGRDMEAKILDYMSRSGFRLAPATKYEDMHLKIDAFLYIKHRYRS